MREMSRLSLMIIDVENAAGKVKASLVLVAQIASTIMDLVVKSVVKVKVTGR